MYEDDSDDEVPVDVLSTAVGLPRSVFVDAVGGRWRRVLVVADDELTDPECWGKSWYACGTPVHLLLGVGSGEVMVAAPVGRWVGHALRIEPDGPFTFRTSDIAEQVDTLRAASRLILTASRGQMAWCPLCLELQSPWEMGDSGECYPCMSEHRGIVF